MLIVSNILASLCASAGGANKFVLDDDRGMINKLRPNPYHRFCAGRANGRFEFLYGLSNVVDHQTCSRMPKGARISRLWQDNADRTDQR